MTTEKNEVQEFCNQIADAVDKLGRETAITCMARSLIFVAMEMQSSLKYRCDEGAISVTRNEKKISG
tara:strand:+ start:2282 stop:2482 length:201 start_codon:yes stop_codon:yes gene_type:complete